MAINKKYISQIENQFCDLITYWCLIRYTKLVNKTKKIKEWKDNLLNLFILISEIDLSKNNTEIRRKHTLKQMMKLCNFKTRKIISIINWTEFENEDIDVKTDLIYKQTVTEYIKETKKIIGLIAKQDESKIKEYIKKL
mgnify:CR=1 FL=1